MGGFSQVSVPQRPTITGPHGILYDFNEGCRAALPIGHWRIRMSDLATGSLLVDQSVDGPSIVASRKKYYVPFHLEVWRDDLLVFEHFFDPNGRQILVRMEAGGLGDQLAWIGHVAEFARKHTSDVTCCVRPDLIPLLQPAYPWLSLRPVTDIDPAIFYATYKVFIFYNDHGHDWSPCDYRLIGLCHVAAYILGLRPVERRPLIAIDEGGPPIDEPYVCIAVQASTQSKYWNNPTGWSQVVTCLREAGYRVVCIDQATVGGRGMVWNHIPHGVEDQTGNRPLGERARWLRHAAFFIGLSSGLAWLAWAAEAEIVLISGFTHPINEFATPYRVINFHSCNGCANDIRHQLDPTDFLWCPRHKDTERMFECTRLIDAKQVIRTIGTMPGFADAGRRHAVKQALQVA